MTAHIARLQADPPQAGPFDDRRRERRFAARALASLRSSRGESADIAIIDVSTHGCAVMARDGLLRAGSFVTIGLGENPELAAIVRWVRDGTAGMEFLAPIPPDRAEWHDLMEDPCA